MDHVECVVVGAGVVGLAVARALALSGREVLVLESENAFGTATSSRNSEVIHAGLYYPTNSLKARLCVAGRRRLYDYCAARGIAHRKLGKLVVATRDDQVDKLHKLVAQARANEVEGCELISAQQAQALEPALRCVAALLSRETGIIDSHGLMLALLGELEGGGGMVAYASPFDSAHHGSGHWVVRSGGAEAMEISCDWLINSAGLQALEVARRIDELAAEKIPHGWLSRGCYFTLSGRTPFSRLIYPLPAAGGLGVHLTLDLAGQGRFGPDTEWIDRVDYTVDPRRADRFYAEVREYWPALPDHSLQPSYAGIRPKLHGPGTPPADFVIDGPADNGVARLVNLYGIESPGLTASLAIGDAVNAIVARD